MPYVERIREVTGELLRKTRMRYVVMNTRACPTCKALAEHPCKPTTLSGPLSFFCDAREIVIRQQRFQKSNHAFALACPTCHAPEGKCCRDADGANKEYCEGRVIRESMSPQELRAIKAEGRRKQAAWERAKRLIEAGCTRLAAYKCEDCGAEEGQACRDENENLAAPCECRQFKPSFITQSHRNIKKLVAMQG